MSTTSKARPVIMLQDGAIDESVAEVLLATASGIDLQAVIMVDADCIGPIACDVQARINTIAAVDVPVGLSSARALNAFPWAYRSDCIRMRHLPALQAAPANGPALDGDALLAQLLDNAAEPLTIVATGPVTPLVSAIIQRPERVDSIAEVVWMAGAIDVPGNLDPTTLPIANPYAEWNVFWDPPGAQALFDHYTGPITVQPLDLSNRLPIGKIDRADTFMARLFEAGHHSAFARFCLDAYGLVASEPFYRLWDTGTVAYLLRPDLFAETVVMPMRVCTERGPNEGALQSAPDGKPLRLVLDFGAQGASGVSDFIVEQIIAAC